MTETPFRELLTALEAVWSRGAYRFDDGDPIPPRLLARYLTDALTKDDDE